MSAHTQSLIDSRKVNAHLVVVGRVEGRDTANALGPEAGAGAVGVPEIVGQTPRIAHNQNRRRGFPSSM